MVKNHFNNFKKPMLSSQTPKTYLAHDVENTPNRIKVVNQPHSPLELQSAPTRRRETSAHRKAVQDARSQTMKKFIQDRQDKRDAERAPLIAENQRKVAELKRKRKVEADRYEKASFFGLNPTERKIVMGAAIGGAVILTGGLAAGALGIGALGVGAAEATELTAAEIAAQSAGDFLSVPLLAEESGASGAAQLAADEAAVAESGTLGASQTAEEAADAELNEFVNQSTEQELTAADNEISDQALQREIDEQGIDLQVESELPSSSTFVNEAGLNEAEQGTLDSLNQAARTDPARFSQLASEALAQGQRGAAILAQVGAIATLPGAAVNMIQQAKEIHAEKNISKKLGMLATLVGQANQHQSVISGKELIQLENLGHTLTSVGDSLNQIEKAGEVLNVIANKELQIEKNNNQQLKILIDENKGEAEAQKHGQVMLDNELQQLEAEEKIEEDISMRIATTLDRPAQLSDFIKDLQSFNSEKSKIDYVVENYSTFISLGQGDINSILDMLNSSNAIAVF